MQAFVIKCSCSNGFDTPCFAANKHILFAFPLSRVVNAPLTPQEGAEIKRMYYTNTYLFNHVIDMYAFPGQTKANLGGCFTRSPKLLDEVSISVIRLQ